MASQSTPKQSGKEAKDLACLVAALRSSRTKLDIDYDEFMKLDGAPTKQAAQMRLHRLGKSLGVEFTGGGSRGGGAKVPKDWITPKTAGKRKPTPVKPKLDAEEGSEGDEVTESPSKKMRSEKTSHQTLALEEESRGENGHGADGETN